MFRGQSEEKENSEREREKREKEEKRKVKMGVSDLVFLSSLSFFLSFADTH